MNEVSVALINRLPQEFLMIVIMAVIIFAIYVLPRLKRDKNGKLYVYSRQYEANQKKQKTVLKQIDGVTAAFAEMKESIANLTARCTVRGDCLDDVRQRIARIEILDMITHTPHKKERIMNAYDEYKKNRWNGYLDMAIDEWRKKYQGNADPERKRFDRNKEPEDAA